MQPKLRLSLVSSDPRPRVCVDRVSTAGVVGGVHPIPTSGSYMHGKSVSQIFKCARLVFPHSWIASVCPYMQEKYGWWRTSLYISKHSRTFLEHFSRPQKIYTPVKLYTLYLNQRVKNGKGTLVRISDVLKEKKNLAFHIAFRRLGTYIPTLCHPPDYSS